ncbi:AraC family transcriptional regulator [Amycolatopsis plumensis]|uniref:AraC family transcriptional regulator n=1 Tax=Amycolatopsis plumensis TaxID=236508 RepID=A0ABV5UIE8_9PSEU
MDVLTDLLERAGARRALFGKAEFAGPWALDFDEAPGLAIHVIDDGAATLDSPEGSCHLRSGDVVLVRADVPHQLSGGNKAVPVKASTFFPAATMPHQAAHTPTEEQPRTRLLCGAYRWTGDLMKSINHQLPPVLVVHASSATSLNNALALLRSQLEQDDAGRQAILDRLLDVVLIELLREHLRNKPTHPPGWFRALDEPAISTALEVMHSRAGDPWTVATLAKVVGLSRAAFSALFTRTIGSPPMAYLHSWRMALARDHLLTSTTTISEVGRAIGYTSEFAFSAAFKKAHGLPPGTWRKEAGQIMS